MVIGTRASGPRLILKSNPSEVGERPANRVGERGDAAPGAAADMMLDDDSYFPESFDRVLQTVLRKT